MYPSTGKIQSKTKEKVGEKQLILKAKGLLSLVIKTNLICSQRPVVVEKVHHGKWHGHWTEKEVRDDQVQNEDIPGGFRDFIP